MKSPWKSEYLEKYEKMLLVSNRKLILQKPELLLLFGSIISIIVNCHTW